MMRVFACFALLALGACSSGGQEPANEIAEAQDVATANAMVALPQEATDPGSLIGQWRVAGINGSPWDESVGWAMTADITTDRIALQSQCMGFGRSYRMEVMLLSHLPPPPPATQPAPPPAPQCLRMPLPQEQQASKALQAATRAYRMPDGSLVLDGPEGSITLFTQ